MCCVDGLQQTWRGGGSQSDKFLFISIEEALDLSDSVLNVLHIALVSFL